VRTQTTKESYNGKPINTGERHKLPCYQEVLKRLEYVMSQALSKHAKVLFFRLDLRFPVTFIAPQDNNYMMEFMKRYVEKLEYKKLSTHYLWVRERNTSLNHHYHLLMMLDGYKTMNAFKHVLLAQELWPQVLKIEGLKKIDLKGLVQHCNQENACLMIHRNDKESINEAFFWGSYLAKVKTKEHDIPFRSMGSSRLNSNITLI